MLADAEIISIAPAAAPASSAAEEAWGEAGAFFERVEGAPAPDPSRNQWESSAEERWRELKLFAQEDSATRVGRIYDRIDGALARAARANASDLLYLLALDGKGHAWRIAEDKTGEGGPHLAPAEAPDWMGSYAVAANITRPIVTELSSRLAPKGSYFQAAPLSRDQRVIGAAKTATGIARALVETPDCKRTIDRYAGLLPALGAAILKEGWSSRATSTVRLPDGRMARGPYGWFEWKALSSLEMRVPAGISSLDEAEWVADQQLVPFSRVVRDYPSAQINPYNRPAREAKARNLLLAARNLEERAFERYAGCGASSQSALAQALGPMFAAGQGASLWAETAPGAGNGQGLNNQRERSAMSGDPDELVLLTDFYERCWHPEMGEYWQRTVVCGGVELETRPHGALFTDPATGQTWAKLQPDGRPKVFNLPYHWTNYQQVPGSLRGRGVIYDTLEFSRNYTAAASLLMENGHNITANYTFMRDGDALLPDYYGVFTGMHYRYEKPEHYKIKAQIQELIQLAEWLRQQVELMAMRPEVRRGDSPGSGISGRAINSLIGQSDGAWAVVRSRAMEGLAESMTGILELLQWMAPEEMVLGSLRGGQDKTGYIAFRGIDLAGATALRVTLTRDLPSDPVARLDIADRLAAAGQVDQQGYWKIVAGTGTLDEIDRFGLSEEQARGYIEKILSWPEAAAAAALQTVSLAPARAIQARGAMMMMAPEAFGPAERELAAAQALNEALKAFDIGVEDFHDARAQGNETWLWLNSSAGDAASAPHRALVAARWKALADRAGGMAAALASAARSAPGPGGSGPGASGGSPRQPALSAAVAPLALPAPAGAA